MEEKNICLDLLKFNMIKKVEVLISFPMGAKFRENLDLSIYRKSTL